MAANTSGKGTTGKVSIERLVIVAELLTQCVSTAEIEHTLAAEWELDVRTVRRYISKVRKAWAANGVQAGKEERAFSRVRNKRALELVVHQNIGKVKAEHQRVAVTALHRLNEMDGLTRQRVELTGKDGKAIEVNNRDGGLMEKLQRLEREAEEKDKAAS